MPAITCCFSVKQNHAFEKLAIRRGMYANFRSGFKGDLYKLTDWKQFLTYAIAKSSKNLHFRSGAALSIHAAVALD